MIKNKFNIGQTVVVIEGRKVVEKIVESIKQGNKELEYALTGDTKSKIKAVAIQRDTWPNGFARTYCDPAFLNIAVFDDGIYKESEIFENEKDFKDNLKIKKLPQVKVEEE